MGDEKETANDTRRDWALPLAIAAVPLVAAAVRLYLFARGDPQVFAALIGNANLSVVWIVAITTIIPTLAFAVPPYVLVRLYVRQWRRLHVSRSGLRTRGLFPILLGCLILSFTLAWLFLVGPAFYIAPIGMIGLVIAYWFTDRKVPWKMRGESMDAFAARAARHRSEMRAWVWPSTWWVAGVATYGLVVGGPLGPPLEVVRIDNEVASAGYVVGVDDTALTLAYRDGGVRRILNDQVAGRHVCPTYTAENRDRWPGIRVLLNDADQQPYVPPECSSEAPTRTN